MRPAQHATTRSAAHGRLSWIATPRVMVLVGLSTVFALSATWLARRDRGDAIALVVAAFAGLAALVCASCRVPALATDTLSGAVAEQMITVVAASARSRIARRAIADPRPAAA